MPANPGVNPSLTITALAEHAMSRVAPKPGAATAAPIRLMHEAPGAQTAVIPGDSGSERAAGLRSD